MGKKDKAKQMAEAAKEQVKNKFKRKIIQIIAIAILPIITAVSFYSIMMTVESKLIELKSNLTTAVTSFWKWMTDDYWIKLDKEIEFSYLDEETRRRNYN